MNKSTIKRFISLLPKGTPRYVRCYDNDGKTADRYTVIFTGNYRKGSGMSFQYLAMNSEPFHPQGFGQHGESDRQIDVNSSGFAPAMGRKNHLGTRIPFSKLPSDCKELVMRDYRAIWRLSAADDLAFDELRLAEKLYGAKIGNKQMISI